MLTYIIFYSLAIFLILTPLLVHEAGHWALLRRYHVPVRQFWLGLGPAILHVGKLRVGMLPLGGAVVPDSALYQELTAQKRLFVALAGPAFSAVFALACAAAQLLVTGQAQKTLQVLSALNWFMCWFNLLPLPPLDGFQAYCNWRELKKQPFADAFLLKAKRLGNGLLYGAGFLAISVLFFA